MRNFSSEGLVIKRLDINEADKIVTIFSKHQGKISAIAKGVRKITSRRAGNLELLTHVKFFTAGNGKLPVLTEASTISSFKNIQTDLTKLSLAYLMLELVDQFLPDGQENSKLYNNILLFLSGIDQSEDIQKANLLAASFQIKLLRETGYLPELYHCVSCGEKLEGQHNYLVPNSGGLVDQDCSRNSLFANSIRVDSIKVIRFINNEGIERISKLKLDGVDVTEICKILNTYTVAHLDRNLGSEKFAFEIGKLSLAN